MRRFRPTSCIPGRSSTSSYSISTEAKIRSAAADLEAGYLVHQLGDLMSEADRFRELARSDRRRTNECDHDASSPRAPFAGRVGE